MLQLFHLCDEVTHAVYNVHHSILAEQIYILIHISQIQKHQRHRKAKCFESQFSERANVSLQRQELWRGQTNCVWPIYGSKPPQTIVAPLPPPILMIAELIHHYVV